MPEQFQPLFTHIIEMVRTVLSDSHTVVFLFGMSLLIVAFVLVIFLKEIPSRTSNDMKAKANEVDEDKLKKEPALN
ncbi:hypothetical protein FHS15_002313 [Paenibacillus castaneae]|uniref:hypothetical protein n=1 Tax=Paenibacillus castaneae TaxID=474957 RepID=UPI000C99C553|nr:hypothetical protein [Paenibacillus castaneae]NIK77188.1 hypothetical protein [Paenibacillus castaneae]